jgi:hypothetical protein
MAKQVGELAVNMVDWGRGAYKWGVSVSEGWAGGAVRIPLQRGVVEGADDAVVIDALQGAKGADAVIAKAGVLKGAVGGGAFGRALCWSSSGEHVERLGRVPRGC